ncbi:MAG: DUF4445 domain-containing protein, partial [Actinomyces sp.]
MPTATPTPPPGPGAPGANAVDVEPAGPDPSRFVSDARHRIVFTPAGVTGTVPDDTTVLEAARLLGVDVDSVCGGRGVCGRCQVVTAPGHHATWGLTVGPDAVSPPGPTETDYRGHRPLAPGHRLACATTVRGDVVVDVPPASQVHRQIVAKDLGGRPVELDPLCSLHYLERPGGDERRTGRTTLDGVLAALAAAHGLHLTPADVEPRALPSLHRAGRDGAVTVAVRRLEEDPDRPGRLVAAWPGFVDRVVGVAVDVGSTTLAAHLCDLLTGAVLATESRMNPQIRFGEDLMSRVSFVMMNPDGATALTGAVREAIDGLVEALCEAAGVERDRVLEVTAVGNPVMHHLLAGIDPTSLGQAPFTLATTAPIRLPAGELGLDLPHATAWLGPCIAGHVGADAAAALVAEGLHRHEAATARLLVDVGTNAEIVLAHEGRLFAASSPTGPAFEGAQISCGQRATVGAIERVRIDPVTLEPRVRVIGVDTWSDDPDFPAALAAATGERGVTGVCGSGIVEAMAEMYLTGICAPDGTIGGGPATPTARLVDDGRTHAYVLYGEGDAAITVTQNDVRAIQLAKAALRAGIELVWDHAGRPPLDEILLAGGFGTRLDPLHVCVLGLVPDHPVEKVRAVGNAAGAGAVAALLSARVRGELAETVERVVRVETATEPRFQELFVAAMAIPHADGPRPHLAAAASL